MDGEKKVMTSSTSKAGTGAFIIVIAGLFVTYLISYMDEKGIFVDKITSFGVITLGELMGGCFIIFVLVALLYIFLR